MPDAGQLPVDRTRAFETPPPPPLRREAPAPAARLPDWVSEGAAWLPVVLLGLAGTFALRRRRGRVALLRALSSLAGAIVAGAGGFFATNWLGCRAIACDDAAGFLPTLAGLGIGLAAGIAALAAGWKLTAPWALPPPDPVG